MKPNRLLLILLLLLPVLAWAKGPQIKFLDSTHEFGNIKEKGGKVATEFRFVNTGDAPLVIISAKGSCGCTKPSFDEAPIAPGDTSVIKVTYNPDGRPGEFIKTVTVKSNSQSNSTTRLKIKGVVIPDHK